MKKTKQKVIASKFAVKSSQMLSRGEMVDAVVRQHDGGIEFNKRFLALVYKLRINGWSNSSQNFRQLVSDLNVYSGAKMTSDVILAFLNGEMPDGEDDNSIVGVMHSWEYDNIQLDFPIEKNPFFEMRKANYLIEEAESFGFDEFSQFTIEKYEEMWEDFQELFDLIWEKGDEKLRNIHWQFDKRAPEFGEKSMEFYISHSDSHQMNVEHLLLKIYDDVKYNRVQDNYVYDNINELSSYSVQEFLRFNTQDESKVNLSDVRLNGENISYYIDPE